ncbi:MAG: signal recognition particle receptor subunit alpha, partial [Candidatus Krumholzibacteria bacterium]|nr:signal recognition particle receptor subunit alpha [Candidatus Krumholzibacteria bacterium]
MFNLKAKLQRARASLVEPLARVFQRGPALAADDVDEVEALLLSADVGVDATDRAVAALRERGAADYRETLREIFLSILQDDTGPEAAAKPRAIVVVGINGVGKTTSIGKLAFHLKARGERVLLAACDTFRAAAADQLGIWAERVGVDMIRHAEGTDPA